MTDPKRPPPTIDLEPNPPAGESAWRRWSRAFRRRGGGGFGSPSSRLALVAAASGALAALIVAAAFWFAGLIAQRAPQQADDLAARLARIEARLATPAAPATDPALAARIAGVEQAVESVRQASQQMQQTIQSQSEAVTSSLNEIKAAPRAPDVAVDLSPLNKRIGELEQMIRGLSAPRAEPEAVSPALARMIVANQLAAALRNGEPYAAALAAAKQGGDAAMLAPLEAFAASGVPNDVTLARELNALLPQLEPKPQAAAQPAPSGWVERLEASAARLVRVRPAGDDASSLVSRIATAARGNDVATARRELDRLPAAQRAPAQGWIARYDAREAARKAALDFAAQALVALPQR